LNSLQEASNFDTWYFGLWLIRLILSETVMTLSLFPSLLCSLWFVTAVDWFHRYSLEFVASSDQITL
jgi:hypothetical protein